MPQQTMAPQPIAFPIKGLHEGVGYDFQPPGTTADALNVCGYDTLKNRLRGGRRAGSSKFFDDPINGSEVIQAIAKTVQGTAYTGQDPDSRPTTIVDDDFSSYAQTRPTYLGENWVYKDQGDSINEGSSMNPGDHWGVTANGLLLDGAYTSTAGHRRYLLLPLRFEGPNDVTVTMRARPQANTTNSNTGGADDCQCMGPFIRADSTMGSFVFACLIRQGASTTVRLRIVYFTPATETTLVESSDITLSGDAGTQDDFEISLSENLATNLITATLTWPGAGPAAANLSSTISVTDTTNNVGSRRQGIGLFGRADLTIAAATAYRTFKRVITSYYNDSLPAVAATIANTDGGTNQFFIPAGFTSVRISAAGSGSFFSQQGPYDSNSTPANSLLRVDSTNNVFNSVNDVSADAFGGFFRDDPLSGGGPFNPEIVLRSGISAASAGLQFFVRFNSTYKDGISVKWDMTEPTSIYATTGVAELERIIVQKITANDVASTYATFQVRMPIHRNSTIRVEDDGSVIKFYVDNVLLESQQATSDYSTQQYVGGGMYDESGTNDSIVREVRWRQRPASSEEELPLGTTSSAKLVIVSGGSVFGLADDVLTTTTNGTNAMTAERFQVQMQSAFNRTFMVDGVRSKQYNLADNTVSNWVATEGDLPESCRLIALYRGRMVLSGKVDDPHNWFMAKLGDPFDWDYDPAITSVIQAVAGNNSETGLVGDIITALVPFSDDVLIFGGDHTIYALTGDPAAGGTIDIVSDKTGMAFGKAWTKDPNGNLYFWGQDGVYVMAGSPGSKPESLTKGRIDVRVRNVDQNFNRIFMEWDYLRDRLVILITPSNINTACRVLVWERRSDAWWEFEYPTEHGPNILFAYDSVDAEDQAFILGGRDSYLRMTDEAAEGDDGEDIVSRFRYPQFLAPTQASEVVLNSVLPVLASGSGQVNLDVYTGQSAEECVLSQNPRVRRLLTHAGRNSALRQKVRGYAVQLGMSHSGQSRWALEGCSVRFDEGGMPRREARTSGS